MSRTPPSIEMEAGSGVPPTVIVSSAASKLPPPKAVDEPKSIDATRVADVSPDTTEPVVEPLYALLMGGGVVWKVKVEPIWSEVSNFEVPVNAANVTVVVAALLTVPPAVRVNPDGSVSPSLLNDITIGLT